MSPKTRALLAVAFLLALSSCDARKSVRPTLPADSPPALPQVDCDSSLKVIPPELPEPTSDDPNELATQDDFIIRTYGEARRQLIALVACVERWRTETAPKP